MSNLAKFLAIVTVWLVAGSAVGSTPPPPPPVGPMPPFVKVTIPKEPLQLGDLWSGGAFQAGAQVNVHVLANCPYQVDASFRDLRFGTSDQVMSPTQLMVAINGKRTTLGGRVPVVLSRQPTPLEGVDIPVELQVGVNDFMKSRAGRYNGTLVITVMAVP